MIKIIKTFVVPCLAIVAAFFAIVGGATIVRWAADLCAEDIHTDSPVTPELRSDNIVPEYIESVHQQSAACDELVKTLEKCDRVLGECMSMLESHHLIPKQAEEANYEEMEETNER